jgi:D-glycerate 3-kinase
MSINEINIDKYRKFLEQFCCEHKISSVKFKNNFKNAYLPLINKVLLAFGDRKNSGAFVLGVNGAQGAGKSTLCALMKDFLSIQFGLNVVVLSIDDLYKTQLERQRMASDVHQLFATRGVPGTHDVALGMHCLQALKNNPENNTLLVPRFSKASDDRLPKELWTKVQGAVDIIIFEGWCVATKPQVDTELNQSVNDLEVTQDKQSIWRTFVNDQLKNEYQELFKLIDYLLFIKPLDYNCIFNWRYQQEIKLIEDLTQRNQSLLCTMDEDQLIIFMQHFERLSKHNQAVLSNYANAILYLDKNRNGTLDIK